MKKVLIITSHPSSHGFTHAIADHYAKAVKKNGDKVEILNLYHKENYQPFLSFESPREWPEENVKRMQDKIANSDELVFCFPIWWGAAPAIMKNWLDYNLTSGFAFKYTPKGIVKLLEGKTAKVFGTSDAPGFAYDFILAPLRITWSKMSLGFCGIKTTSFKVFGHIRKSSEADRQKILDQVEKLALK